jgi:hypothetical protein
MAEIAGIAATGLRRSSAMNSLDDPRLVSFLEALRQGQTVDTARQEARLNWKLLYNLKRNSPEFLEAWTAAMTLGKRSLSKVKTMTAENMGLFLDALSGGASVSVAAEGSGINSASYYKRRKKDPEFARLWDEAVAVGSNAVKARSQGKELEVFVREIQAGKSSREASQAAGKDLTTFYRRKRRDPQFAAEWNDAIRASNGGLAKRQHKPPAGADWGGLSWAGREGASVKGLAQDAQIAESSSGGEGKPVK